MSSRLRIGGKATPFKKVEAVSDEPTVPADRALPRNSATPFQGTAQEATAERAPASSAAAATGSALTVEQYASLCAAMDNGMQPAEAFQRFGLDQAQFLNAAKSWSAQFDATPALRVQFNALKRQYSDWFQQQAQGAAPSPRS